VKEVTNEKRLKDSFSFSWILQSLFCHWIAESSLAAPSLSQDHSATCRMPLQELLQLNTVSFNVHLVWFVGWLQRTV